MIAVNQLIQDAYESINMTGLGESTDGDMAKVGVKELNRAIATLNAEGYISMSQKWVDAPCSRSIYFRKLLEGEYAPDTIDMEPPESIEAVARKIGNRYLPLVNGNLVQMSMYNPSATASTWTYNVELETDPTDHVPDNRLVGILSFDGTPRQDVRIWYNSKLPKYDLDQTIYLSDLYNELLMSALCVRLANFYELSDQKKAALESDLLAAKTLIKRKTATQRMLQCGQLIGDWRDSYTNGLNGVGM